MASIVTDTISAFVEGASDAGFAVDENLTIVGWNRRASDLLGYTQEQAIGQHCADILQAMCSNGEPLCVPGCSADHCFRENEPFEARACKVPHKNGSWIPVSLSSVAISKSLQASLHSDAIAVVYVHGKDGQKDHPLTDPTLRIFTLGHFGLNVGAKDLAVEHWERKQSLTVLKYLAAHRGRTVPRDVLIDCLWPTADELNGRKRLKATIYSLRQQLRAAGLGEHVVETANEAYLLRCEATWVDTDVFERCIAEGDTSLREKRWGDALKHYREAERLYRGDYLEEDIHSDWCAEERERFRQIHMEMLINMADCHDARSEYAEAAAVYRKILTCDSCRESTHRALMECLVQLGHPESALAQYRYCQDVLTQELDVEPMPETTGLYLRILADS